MRARERLLQTWRIYSSGTRRLPARYAFTFLQGSLTGQLLTENRFRHLFLVRLFSVSTTDQFVVIHREEAAPCRSGITRKPGIQHLKTARTAAFTGSRFKPEHSKARTA